jgi:hypothetical protein
MVIVMGMGMGMAWRASHGSLERCCPVSPRTTMEKEKEEEEDRSEGGKQGRAGQENRLFPCIRWYALTLDESTTRRAKIIILSWTFRPSMTKSLMEKYPIYTIFQHILKPNLTLLAAR